MTDRYDRRTFEIISGELMRAQTELASACATVKRLEAEIDVRRREMLLFDLFHSIKQVFDRGDSYELGPGVYASSQLLSPRELARRLCGLGTPWVGYNTDSGISAHQVGRALGTVGVYSVVARIPGETRPYRLYWPALFHEVWAQLYLVDD